MKREVADGLGDEAVSLPTRERELKLLRLAALPPLAESLPTRERELKHGKSRMAGMVLGSLPTRERELKPFKVDLDIGEGGVAPYTGA